MYICIGLSCNPDLTFVFFAGNTHLRQRDDVTLPRYVSVRDAAFVPGRERVSLHGSRGLHGRVVSVLRQQNKTEGCSKYDQ